MLHWCTSAHWVGHLHQEGQASPCPLLQCSATHGNAAQGAKFEKTSPSSHRKEKTVLHAAGSSSAPMHGWRPHSWSSCMPVQARGCCFATLLLQGTRVCKAPRDAPVMVLRDTHWQGAEGRTHMGRAQRDGHTQATHLCGAYACRRGLAVRQARAQLLHAPHQVVALSGHRGQLVHHRGQLHAHTHVRVQQWRHHQSCQWRTHMCTAVMTAALSRVGLPLAQTLSLRHGQRGHALAVHATSPCGLTAQSWASNPHHHKIMGNKITPSQHRRQSNHTIT